tara:strand:- start:3811 stop:4278 length:468 start_codon:yes stop_codon:yes gene_type:complete
MMFVRNTVLSNNTRVSEVREPISGTSEFSSIVRPQDLNFTVSQSNSDTKALNKEFDLGFRVRFSAEHPAHASELIDNAEEIEVIMLTGWPANFAKDINDDTPEWLQCASDGRLLKTGVLRAFGLYANSLVLHTTGVAYVTVLAHKLNKTGLRRTM